MFQESPMMAKSSNGDYVEVQCGVVDQKTQCIKQTNKEKAKNLISYIYIFLLI